MKTYSVYKRGAGLYGHDRIINLAAKGQLKEVFCCTKREAQIATNVLNRFSGNDSNQYYIRARG